MRKVKKIISIVAVCSMMVVVLAACSKSSTTSSSAAPTTTVAPADTAAAETPQASIAATAAAQNPDDLYFGKYDPPITVTLVKRTTQGRKYQGDDSEENNSWTRLLKEHGIIVKYIWMQDASQYESKMNVAISTNEIPDLLYQITSTQANTLIKGDQLLDMKPYLDKYLSPQAKELLYADPGMMNGLMKDGQQLLLPSGAAEIRADIKALWIRKDWLAKVNLPIPKTIADFRKVSDAFTNQDPDGNGKKDTYGFGISGKDNLIIDWAGLSGFFEMFHAQPGTWWDGSFFYEKDSSGKAIWSGSKPGVKEALTTLQDMYKKGELAKDFGTIDGGGKMAQDIVGSKVGMFSGAPWHEDWPLPDLRTKTPTADWVIASFPTVDGTPVTPTGYMPGNVYKAVSKNTKHPEAIVQMINLYVEKLYGKTQDLTNFAGLDANDYGKWKDNAPFILDDLFKNSKDYTAISEGVQSKDPSKLNAEQKIIYDDIVKFQTDPSYVKGWSAYQKASGAEGTAGKHYYSDIKESDVLKNLWFTFPTETMASKSATYKKMAEEQITKIIYGQAPVSDWDKTVASWNKLGGDEITKEVQASIK